MPEEPGRGPLLSGRQKADHVHRGLPEVREYMYTVRNIMYLNILK